MSAQLPQLDVDAIRELAFDIEEKTADTRILLIEIQKKLDGIAATSDVGIDLVNTIHCFLSCALQKIDESEKSNQATFGLLFPQAGLAEGYAIWRRAQAETAGAA